MLLEATAVVADPASPPEIKGGVRCRRQDIYIKRTMGSDLVGKTDMEGMRRKPVAASALASAAEIAIESGKI